MAEKRYRTPGEYPAGEDDFPSLRQRNCLYVDKTAYIYNLTRLKYVFLSRPRRFGKSLLCSTLEAYFQGKRDLFKGLAIDSPEMETEWKAYPVLRFNISSIKDMTVSEMALGLDQQLRKYEKIYDRDELVKAPGKRLKFLIESALDHIETKQYIEPWHCGETKITKCAARFSAKDRTLTDWKFVEVE